LINPILQYTIWLVKVKTKIRKDTLMKIIAINGSPRKDWNTGALLKSALEGAASEGAQTEIINLYDLSYKGCISCFACKLAGGKSSVTPIVAGIS
jgi:multimeric flavodoxin WrbA